MKRTDEGFCAFQASAFEHRIISDFMVLTRDTAVLVRPEQKVRHTALDTEGSFLAWVEGSKQVFIADLIGGHQVEVKTMFEHPYTVSLLMIHQGQVFVGDDLDGLHIYQIDGSVVRQVPLDGGVLQCYPLADGLVAITGMGHLVLMNHDGQIQPDGEVRELDDCLHLAVHDSVTYVATQSGDVVAIEAGRIVWRRPKRGEFGERITALGTTSGGGLFLTREGHALVGGEEEAIEFELWANNSLLLRQDQRMRLLTSSPSPQGAILGYDDGSVFTVDEEGNFTHRFSTGHPVFQCLEYGEHIIAGSWFYLTGMTEDTVWKVEHQGMPTMLVLNRTAGTLVFAGDDQNDYTAPEPIGVIDLAGTLQEVDEAELGLWFERSEAAAPLTAEALYTDNDDVLEHLTDEERATYATDPVSSGAHRHLLDAMGDVNTSDAAGTSVEENEQSQSHDEGELFDALAGFEDLAMDIDEADLLTMLEADVTDVHRPQAIAGEDQQVVADQDGTAIVHLDGRGTMDPHGLIERWSWHNERGEELSNSQQLKLRLPTGVHRFELRVVDAEGSWTTDSLTVEVNPSSTS